MRNGILAEEVLYPPVGWGQAAVGSSHIDELARSNKELAQFAFLAAHDLQEPLKVAFAYAQQLDRKYKGKLDEKADAIISAILDSTLAMQKLIQNLLHYSQADKGSIQLHKLNADDVLKKALQNLKVTIEENSAQIFCQAMPVVMGDEIQLTQLFQNLITNAIKFRQKGLTPCIHVSVEDRAGHWLFGVRDNGIGIEPAHLCGIFELFKKLHPQSEYKGNGIGLGLCKRIVESHKGRIWAVSEIGKGSAIYFTIPQGI